MLSLEAVSTFYGNFEALRAVSLEVRKGEMVSIIGANGAGKTTMMRTICGLERHRKGRILFDRRDIGALATVERVKRGIVYCPESRKLFPEMTVLENLEMGAYTRSRSFKRNLARVLDIFPVLAEKRNVTARSLSGGQQQMLAVGRALMAEPSLLLLDEPSTGLAPLVAEQLMDVVRSLNAEGMTVLLVEQNVHLALEFANRGYVLENGRIIREGPAEVLREDEEVKRSYLGG